MHGNRSREALLLDARSSRESSVVTVWMSGRIQTAVGTAVSILGWKHLNAQVERARTEIQAEVGAVEWWPGGNTEWLEVSMICCCRGEA